MLLIENSLRVEWRRNGEGGRYRLYIFKCFQCINEIKSRKCYFKMHKGLCQSCSAKITILSAQEHNRLRPFESRYKMFIQKIKNDKISTDLTYEDYLEFTKIKECHYYDKSMNWKPYDNNPGFWLDRKENDSGHIK